MENILRRVVASPGAASDYRKRRAIELLLKGRSLQRRWRGTCCRRGGEGRGGDRYKDFGGGIAGGTNGDHGLIILTDADAVYERGERRGSGCRRKLRPMSWRRLPKPMARWDRR